MHYNHSLVCRTFKKLSNGRSSKMRQRKWTQAYLDGCAPFSTFTALSGSSRLNRHRVRGVGLVPKKHHQNHSSSRRSLASTQNLERTTEEHTSSSLRNGTKKLPSIWSRTYRTPIRARHSTRGVSRHRLGRSGIPGLGSRGERCRGWLRRCVTKFSPASASSLY